MVLIKHVPCAIGGLTFAADHTLHRAGVRAQLNEADACAVEVAFRIALRHTGSQITAVTMGPPAAVAALHKTLVLGADEGVHILDDALHGSDVLATSRVLAAATAKLGFDMVLCGAASADSGTSVVPAMVAEHLGVPALCFADTIRAGDEYVEIRRDDGHGAEILRAELPVVVSVTQRCAVPRYPTFAAIIQAQHKLVRTWPLSRLGIEPAAAATRVYAMQRMESRKRVTVEGATAAVQLADFLAEGDFL